MKNCVTGGKHMNAHIRVAVKTPSDARVRKLLKKKRAKKNANATIQKTPRSDNTSI